MALAYRVAVDYYSNEDCQSGVTITITQPMDNVVSKQAILILGGLLFLFISYLRNVNEITSGFQLWYAFIDKWGQIQLSMNGN